MGAVGLAANLHVTLGAGGEADGAKGEEPENPREWGKQKGTLPVQWFQQQHVS